MYRINTLPMQDSYSMSTGVNLDMQPCWLSVPELGHQVQPQLHQLKQQRRCCRVCAASKGTEPAYMGHHQLDALLGNLEP